MSVTERAAERREQASTLSELSGILGVAVDRVFVTGQGANAAVELVLKNGETMQHQKFETLWTQSNLRRWIVQSTGQTVEISKAQAELACALMRRAAGWAPREVTLGDLGTDIGAEFLRLARREPFDLANQADRYRSFRYLETIEPGTIGTASLAPEEFARRCVVLTHRTGETLVPCDWIFQWAKASGLVSHPNDLVLRLQHAGWTRRGIRGRIKATPTGVGQPLTRTFWIVPDRWEMDPEGPA